MAQHRDRNPIPFSGMLLVHAEVELLLKEGASLEFAQDASGNNCLHMVASTGNAGLARSCGNSKFGQGNSRYRCSVS